MLAFLKSSSTILPARTSGVVSAEWKVGTRCQSRSLIETILWFPIPGPHNLIHRLSAVVSSPGLTTGCEIKLLTTEPF